MRYSLIQSKYKCHCGSGIYLGHKYYPQPFFLLQLASKLRAEGHTVKLYDLFRDKPTGHERNEADAVVIGTGEYAADVQRPTIWAEPSIQGVKHYYVGSQAWLNRSAVPTGAQIIEPWEAFGVDPAWDLIDFNNYPKPKGRLRAVLRLTLGCPNHCYFCPVPTIYTKYSGLDVAWSLRQLDYLFHQRGVREFALVDDNLLVNKERMKELLEPIPSRFPGAHFFLQEGIEVRQALDLELCQLLKRAGFYNLRIGVETLNDAVRGGVDKPRFNASEAIQAVSNLKAAGFKDYAVFLIQGLPGNTKEQEDLDVDTFMKIGARIRNHQLIFYPGTETTKKVNDAPSVLDMFVDNTPVKRKKVK